MGPKLFPALVVVSLLANAVLLTVLLVDRGPPPAFGQTANAGDRFILGTERAGEQSPVCFVLSNTDRPQLLVYRLDPAGQLQLTNAREISCDMKLKDNFFPAGGIAKAGKTAPPVQTVCAAVSKAAPAGGAPGAPGAGAGANGKTGASGKEKEKSEQTAPEEEGEKN